MIDTHRSSATIVSPRRRRGRRLWAMEKLEDRVLLSGSPTVYTVSDTSDNATDTGSLRSAIIQANADTNPAGSQIRFDPTVFASPQTITVASTLELSETAGPEVIEGPGAKLVTVSGNNAVRVFEVDSGVTAAISGLIILGGSISDGSGGGIDNSGTLSITNSTFSGNSAHGGALGGGYPSGGGLNNSGTLSISNSTFSGNSANGGALGDGNGSGGGIDNSGTLSVTNSTFSNNSATGGGGVVVGGNGSGGGIDNSGTLSVTNSTFSDNSATGGGTRIGGLAGYGGGIDNSGTLSVTNSTFSGNSANGGIGGMSNFGSGYGGGIDNSGPLSITDSTLSGNSANEGVFGVVTPTPGSGGGIAIMGTENSEAVSINSIFQNSQGGNVYVGVGTPFGSGIFRSSGHNLFSDAPDFSVDPTDLVNTDPLLGPLADNGGPTFTQALLPGSPAIDAGAPVSGVSTDQRGVPRPQVTAPDIGAFESRGFTLTVVNGSGQKARAGFAFSGPLVVRVTSPFGEPVGGGRVTFAAPSAGASAVLRTNLAATDASGQAVVTAVANRIGGAYALTARTAGAMDVAFTLTNFEPPAVAGVVSVTHSMRGIIGITLVFSEDMIPRSATNRRFFSIASGVKKRHKLVFSKRVKIGGVSYDGTAREVTIRLAEPVMGMLQVRVRGGIMATNELSSRGEFTTVVN